MDVVLLCPDIGIMLATAVPGYLEMVDVIDAVGFGLVLELPSLVPQRCSELLHLSTDLLFLANICGCLVEMNSGNPVFISISIKETAKVPRRQPALKTDVCHGTFTALYKSLCVALLVLCRKERAHLA